MTAFSFPMFLLINLMGLHRLSLLKSVLAEIEAATYDTQQRMQRLTANSPTIESSGCKLHPESSSMQA
ncbi:BQ5605_C007g04506 [Microbotryum silenes-dioicae]|uniref:BQ5605_C007g04506 protein n=1 Tax=Microbotryum silenes-dioicae TaxID=796604 RepID=A0A2X0MA61_9BASI|nr:BQ5605_C007g04506 [Microbotryum silenes-dioicae]